MFCYEGQQYNLTNSVKLYEKSMFTYSSSMLVKLSEGSSLFYVLTAFVTIKYDSLFTL